MKVFSYSVAMLLISVCVRAQKSNLFISGFEKTMPSKTLGSQRTIWIHIPNSNGGNEHYPVVYLLDGDAPLLMASSPQ